VPWRPWADDNSLATYKDREPRGWQPNQFIRCHQYSWSVEDDLNALEHTFPPSGGSTCTAGINVCFTDTFSPAYQIVSASIFNRAFQYARPPSGGTTAYAAVNRLHQYPGVTLPSGATVPIA
jgi:hypothetical protein